jgi:hypothetical protein
LFSSASCSPADSRSIPSSLGLLLWPAAHPQNPQAVDLLIAPADVCAQLTPGGVCTTAAYNQLVGVDGVTRFVVGTADSFKVEASETLMCAAG